ncbi:Hypothetical protein R9X50_00059500 [Acrodontium crateriforme]|uniref:N(6)-L-threonylcarbamoyladenine synthase n=1 Tax=Acrodontium crateriforme TaxID=150365 RepID=A0AAQ3LZ30_9PEZI|nr:Hypothetical protein R9X50_00059500 [Acrodontium crateriforme]
MLRLLRETTARAGRRNISWSCSGSFVLGCRSTYRVLAIETSCDDTSVAIVDYKRASNAAKNEPGLTGSLRVLQHSTVTANNDAYAGIHPLVALHSHRANLAPLVKKLLAKCETLPSHSNHNVSDGPSIDLVAVTRGPGMRSNLSVGLDTAKGLALAFNVPLIGVHHMQAHALTSRLLSAMENVDTQQITPRFPFLSVLVSGGHTMLIDSTGLTEHKILAETQDIALGDCLDKAARVILTPDQLKAPYGGALERFSFDQDSAGHWNYNYAAPSRRQDELERRPTEWGWSLSPPLAESKGGEKSSRRMVYSFTGLTTSVERLVKSKTSAASTFTTEERRCLAREVQRIAFEHLASRILLYLSSSGNDWKGDTIVVSGGVASNRFLRYVLRKMLDVRGYSHIELSFPPVSLCTDNALMIAWAGIEMYEAGFQSNLDIGPLNKWSMDRRAADGGILGVGGWIPNCT